MYVILYSEVQTKFLKVNNKKQLEINFPAFSICVCFLTFIMSNDKCKTCSIALSALTYYCINTTLFIK